MVTMMLQGKGGYGSLWNADRIDFEIHGKVELNNEKIMFTAIYGLHSIADRGKLWPALGTIASGVH